MDARFHATERTSPRQPFPDGAHVRVDTVTRLRNLALLLFRLPVGASADFTPDNSGLPD